MKKTVAFSIIGILILAVIIFVITSLWTGSDVRNFCYQYRKIYSGDCVEAGILALDDKANPFEIRNQAVWILGQLGDKRATPYLNKYYTGNTGSDISKSKALSQKEIEKALKLISGKTNLGALIWRHNLP